MQALGPFPQQKYSSTSTSSTHASAGQARCPRASAAHARGQQRQRHVCRADPLFALAATDPSALQDVIVGGAVTAAVSAALVSGLKKEPVPCDLCAGNGGIRCFACSGSTTSSAGGELIDPSILQASSSSSSSSGSRLTRGMMAGGGGRPGSCRVCKGKGLVLCSKCKGSGFVSTF